jgi:ribosomal protein S18 acetylase RimI-like enzyme
MCARRLQTRHSCQRNIKLYKIRRSNGADAPKIVRLVQELAESSGEYSPIDAVYAADYIHQPGCHVLLAEVEGQTVGLLSYLIKPDLFHGSDTCYIAELIVSDGFRDRGVGSALMSNLSERMTTQGCVEISVSTMPDNHAAIRFYKKHGLVDEAILLERHLKTG